ncbi:hypothetical protein OIE69_44395 (plasmid) [Actinacidiphila glaucinigra]|uniref:hypothetical protein n=1 Tax=Actinacidiphila glaucinigra TaxID=235986 RepID=UPI002DD9AB6D|nr:hypothetical protein [Actinacidiphila glaucinigra]WSD65766.1 hypothetical protein OIE69_43455 [Actinacidiphila glaucinigra]WSD65946.1 hypothetical protein OIE69_44395 [Actinacidiphila glaucinigra]
MHGLVFKPTENPAVDTEEAEAPLSGSPGYLLRYVYVVDGKRQQLLLVRPCGHCGQTRENEVRSLAHLGRLLDGLDE